MSLFYIFVETVFTLGFFINAALFIPQAIKVYKRKSSKGLSAITFGGFTVMGIFTSLHAYYKHDYLLLIGNTTSTIVCGCVFFLVLFYRRK